MIRTTLMALAAAALMTLVHGQRSHAQEFPGLGVGNMWANELAFQNQFYNWAAAGSWELAKQIPNNEPLPFNAMTIFNSNNAANQAFQGFANNWHTNSANTMGAIERWNLGAIQGVAPYQNPYGGTTYNLPYGPEGYEMTAPGYMYQGVNPYNPTGNYYPVYGW